MTTAEMTTVEMTTVEMTTAEMTTVEMTTVEMTTAEMTTEGNYVGNLVRVFTVVSELKLCSNIKQCRVP